MQLLVRGAEFAGALGDACIEFAVGVLQLGGLHVENTGGVAHDEKLRQVEQQHQHRDADGEPAQLFLRRLDERRGVDIELKHAFDLVVVAVDRQVAGDHVAVGELVFERVDAVAVRDFTDRLVGEGAPEAVVVDFADADLTWIGREHRHPVERNRP